MLFFDFSIFFTDSIFFQIWNEKLFENQMIFEFHWIIKIKSSENMYICFEIFFLRFFLQKEIRKDRIDILIIMNFFQEK